MPEKDQSLCYRTIKGKKYINWCDILEDRHELEVEKAKRLKIPHRVFKHPDGFSRLFVLETEADRLAAA